MPSSAPFVVLISAKFEWQSVLQQIQPNQLSSSPYGEFFLHTLADFPVIFMHAGWGKVSTAGASQFAIDAFHPQLLINLGTCGGLEGLVELGEILLITETAFYDIYEGMGDPTQAVDFYRSKAALSWIPQPLPEGARLACLASADQDIQPKLTNAFLMSLAPWPPIGNPQRWAGWPSAMASPG